MSYTITGCNCCCVICPTGSGLTFRFTSSNCPELDFDFLIGSGNCFQELSVSPCRHPGNFEDGFRGDCIEDSSYTIYCEEASGVSDAVECPQDAELGDGGVCPELTLYKASESGYYLDFQYISTYTSYDPYPVTDFSNPPCTVFPIDTYYTGGMPTYSGIALTVLNENPIKLSGHVTFGITEGDYCCPIWGSGCEGDIIIECGEVPDATGREEYCCTNTPEKLTVTLTAQSVSGSGDFCNCFASGYSRDFSKNPGNEWCGGTASDGSDCAWLPITYCSGGFHEEQWVNCSGTIGGQQFTGSGLGGPFGIIKPFVGYPLFCNDRCNIENSRYTLAGSWRLPDGGCLVGTTGNDLLIEYSYDLNIDSCDPFQLSGTGMFVIAVNGCYSPTGCYPCEESYSCAVDILVTERT